MDHIDADGGINRAGGPNLIMNVEGERRLNIRETFERGPCCNRSKTFMITFGRLPDEMGHDARKVDDVLTRAAADLQDAAAFGQDPLQHFGNRAFVPFGRGAYEPGAIQTVGIFTTYRHRIPVTICPARKESDRWAVEAVAGVCARR